MIDEQIIQAASIAIVSATAGLLPYPVADVFDDATFILLTFETPPSRTGFIDATVRMELAEALDAIVPTHPRQSFGSWIVVFTHGGKIYDSIYSGFSAVDNVP